MSIEQIMGSVFKLSIATDTLAALGAAAALAASSETIDPEIRAALDAVLEAAAVPSLEGLAPPQVGMVAAAAKSMFGQAEDLLANPARSPGWRYTNPAVLEGQGRASMMVPGMFKGAAPELAEVTAFLDVGTGVGWLAVAAAQLWPGAEIVGVDTWEPALERARANIAGVGLSDRIELRHQNVVDVDDVDRYDCTWVPTFFIAKDVLPVALDTILRATRSGGRVVLGYFEPPPDPIARATIRLRTVRDGGCTLDAASATELLAGGWVEVRELEQSGPAPLGFVVGRKP